MDFKQMQEMWQQQDYSSKKGLDKAIKETLTKMLSDYDTLGNNEYIMTYQKLSMLMMGRMMYQ